MHTSIKFIYFDFNGVLAKKIIDPYLNDLKIFKTTREKVRRARHTVSKYIKKSDKINLSNQPQEEKRFLAKEFLSLAKLFDIKPTEKYQKEYINNHMKLKTFGLFPDTIKTLKSLKQKNINIGILSNALPSRMTNSIIPLGLCSYFSKSLILLSGLIGVSKPDEKYYKIAIHKSNTAPENILFIDDKRKYVEAAKSLGIQGLHMGSDITSIHEVTNYL